MRNECSLIDSIIKDFKMAVFRMKKEVNRKSRSLMIVKNWDYENESITTKTIKVSDTLKEFPNFDPKGHVNDTKQELEISLSELKHQLRIYELQTASYNIRLSAIDVIMNIKEELAEIQTERRNIKDAINDMNLEISSKLKELQHVLQKFCDQVVRDVEENQMHVGIAPNGCVFDAHQALRTKIAQLEQQNHTMKEEISKIGALNALKQKEIDKLKLYVTILQREKQKHM